MLRGLAREWRKFRRAAAGQRFVEQYERHQARQGPWLKPLVTAGVLFAFAMGFVLLVVPALAVVSFVIAALLLPAVSWTAATAYDRLELMLRGRGKRGPRAVRLATADVAPEPQRVEQPRTAVEASIVQPLHDPRRASRVPPRPVHPVAGTTRIWASDLPVPPRQARRRQTGRSTAVRPSQAVVLVPPPVRIDEHTPASPARRRSSA